MLRNLFYKMSSSAEKENGFAYEFYDRLNDKTLVNGLTSSSKQNNSFKVDVLESNDEFKLVADLPGFKDDEIQIIYRDHYLTIHAYNQDDSNIDENLFIRKERSCGAFARSFYIEDIQCSDIDRSYTDGVLIVTLKKTSSKDIDKEDSYGR